MESLLVSAEVRTDSNKSNGGVFAESVVKSSEAGALSNPDEEFVAGSEQNLNNSGNVQPCDNNGSAELLKPSASAVGDDLEEGKVSLNSIYGRRAGTLQSLSMLLNTFLMFYAHWGQSAVILSNQARVEDRISESTTMTTNYTNSSSDAGLTGPCSSGDLEIWENGGQLNRSENSNFCSRGYEGSGCILDKACIIECFEREFGYSADCSACFSDIPMCTLQLGCASACALDYKSTDCTDCNRECVQTFEACTGFPIAVSITTLAPTTDGNTTDDKSSNLMESNFSNAEFCALQEESVHVDTSDRSDFHVVYVVQFVAAIKDAWTGGAYGLAIVVVLFSGFWPYIKNIIIMFIWYRRMTTRDRTLVLTWLKRLGKYTLVDIYAVIIIVVGVMFKAVIADQPVVVLAEPRPAIIAFLVATLWEFCHFEWMTQLHVNHANLLRVESQNQQEDNGARGDDMDDNIWNSLLFRRSMTSDVDASVCKSPFLLHTFIFVLLVLVIGTYLPGSILEIVRFTTYASDSEVGCVKSYNLFTLATEMVTAESLEGNSAKPGVWTLYLSYIFLLFISPLLVFLVQTLVFVFGVAGLELCRVADICWSFASIEIMLLGVLLVQYKFHSLIGALAGNDNAEFFAIMADLGPGFWILLFYSIFAGILHHFFYSAVAEYYKIDPYHKISYVWTKALGPWLVDH